MDAVTCSCANCREYIGDFENQWNQLGKGHCSPVNPMRKGWDVGLTASEVVRIAPSNTTVENSYLQDLICKRCGECMGFKCHDAPPGHILKKDQIVLRLTRMSIVSQRTGKPIAPTIQHVYAVKKDQPDEAPPAVNGAIEKPESEKGEFPPLDDADRLQNMTHFADWAEGAIDTQRTDIDRIFASVSKIEKDMRSFRDFMTTIRKELSVRPTNIEMEELRSTVSSLRDETDPMLSSRTAQGPLSLEDLDTMTESITKIGSKANEVDSIKLELQLLKNKVKRLEDDPRLAGLAGSRAPGTPVPETSRRHIESPAAAKPFVDRIRRAASATEKHTLNSASSDDAKRRRVSGGDTHRPFTLAARPGSRVHKPSRLSDVQVLQDSPKRPQAGSEDMSGMTYVDDPDDDFQPSEPNKRHSAASGTAKDDLPIDPMLIERDELQRKSPNYPSVDDAMYSGRNGFMTEDDRGRGSRSVTSDLDLMPKDPNLAVRKYRDRRKYRSEADKAATKQRRFDVDGCPITANGTRDKRWRTGLWTGGERIGTSRVYHKRPTQKVQHNKDRMDREKQDGEERAYDGEGEMEYDDPEKVMQSVEKDGAPGVPDAPATHETPADSRSRSEETRQAALNARERMVGEMLEREMNMGI